MKLMAKTLIFAIITLTIFLGFQQSYSIPEIDDEVIVGFEHGDAPAIPDWVKSQFEWYVNGEIDEKTLLTSMNWMFDNNIMHLSSEAAQEVQDLREKVEEQESAISSLRTIVSSQAMFYQDDIEDDSDYDYGQIVDDIKSGNDTKAAIAIPNLLDARKSGNESSAISSVVTVDIPSMDGEHIKIFIISDENTDINAFVQWVLRESYLETNKDLEFNADKVRYFNDLKSALETNPDILNPDYESRVKVQFPWMTADFDFASETVDDILRKGGTTSVWEDGIAAISQHEMSESVVPELAGIVVLCNNAIDKKTQSIDAELKILEQWLEMISKEQESSSYDASGRLTSDTTESTVQYRESDFNFISRTLSSIDQEIKALDIGIVVLEEKLSSVGDDAQLANIDLQNSLQKQQQILQTMSNVSKMLHDSHMSIIRNMR